MEVVFKVSCTNTVKNGERTRVVVKWKLYTGRCNDGSCINRQKLDSFVWKLYEGSCFAVESMEVVIRGKQENGTWV